MKNIKKIEQLYTIYEQPMYRIAYAILKNEWQAEDAVSDSFEKIIVNISKIGNPRSEKTKRYVISIIKNAAIDQYRKNSKENQRVIAFDERFQNTDSDYESDVIVQESLSFEKQVNNGSELLSEVKEIINSDFTQEEQKLFDLRFIQEKNYKEIASDYDIIESAARKRTERLRKKIKEVCYGHC